MPLSFTLAQEYVFSGDDKLFPCTHNRKVAFALGRHDLVQIWEIAEFLVKQESTKLAHSDTVLFASKITSQLFRYLEEIDDFQTLATLLAIFCSPKYCIEFEEPRKKLSWNNPYYTSSMALSRSSSAQIPPGAGKSKLRQSLQPMFSHSIGQSKSLIKRTLGSDNILLPADYHRYAVMVEKYANYLYSSRFLDKRIQLLKATYSVLYKQPEIAKAEYAERSKHPAFSCPYCRLPCTGLTSVCPTCSHGGHAHCMSKWFQNETSCITGCGCQCLC